MCLITSGAGRLVFAKGVLVLGDETYNFQEGSSIVSLGQGKFLGWGIKSDALKEASAPGNITEEAKKAPSAVEPEDDD